MDFSKGFEWSKSRRSALNTCALRRISCKETQ
jgi:hypothetical protein